MARIAIVFLPLVVGFLVDPIIWLIIGRSTGNWEQPWSLADFELSLIQGLPLIPFVLVSLCLLCSLLMRVQTQTLVILCVVGLLGPVGFMGSLSGFIYNTPLEPMYGNDIGMAVVFSIALACGACLILMLVTALIMWLAKQWRANR